MKRQLIITLVLFSFASSAVAQSFAPRILLFSKKKEAHIVLKSGDELIGTYKGHKSKKGLIKLVKFQQQGDSSIQEISASDIQHMMLPPSGLGKLSAYSESTSTVSKNSAADVRSILKRDFIYFEQALLPGKAPQYVLLQLVNPGFDEKIKVYDDPRAQRTGTNSVVGIDLSGNMLKSYYLVENGEAYKIKKKDYKKQFGSIYGTCNEIDDTFKSIKFKEFAKHVYIHQTCGS